ncbi:MAG: M28 family metallopeptidase [Actinobacteria bacterium]|nr:M28 family metallopeptidase [Actinomycetota bacterium]
MNPDSETILLDPGRILQTLNEFEDIGNRYHGTPGESRCRDYLAERFNSLRLEDPHLESFRYLAYERESCSCRMVSPQARLLACAPLQFSARGEAEGEAVYLGNAEAADFERVDQLGIQLGGRVVVAHSIAPFLSAPFVAGREIAAFINISQAPDGAIGNFTAVFYPPPDKPPWRGRPLPYPAVTIEAGAGRALISTMTGPSPVVVRVEHECRYVETTAHNVVGRLSGASDEQVVVGAHYDSQADGPCVWDNGTGCAALLEIARALQGVRLARTVTLVGFAVEEAGLCGSVAYVARHSDEMGKVVGMVNLDTVASRYPAKRTIWADEAMRHFADESARQVGWDPEVLFDARQFQFSDNTPFTDAGVPSCWIWNFPPIHPFYHTSGDITELVDPGAVAMTAGASAKVAQRLATDSRATLGRAESPTATDRGAPGSVS